MRIPRWLYPPLMWLSLPRRAVLACTALLTCTIATLVADLVSVHDWRVWGDVAGLAIAAALVLVVWWLATRMEREGQHR